MTDHTISVADGRTDFRTWDRETLERFARQAANENAALQADLKVALQAWRKAELGKVV